MIRQQQPASLPVGTEVYYTGNRCNPGTFGVVAEHKGWNVGIKCDEYGMLWLPQAMLVPCDDNNSGHGSCLFLASEYRAVIQAKLAVLGFVAAPGSWFLAPADDRSNEYAAGYDSNTFATREEAEAAIPVLRQCGEGFATTDWVAVQRRTEQAHEVRP